MERLLEDAEKLSGVDYNIDNLADVYEAVHVIQQEMEITGTTAQEAADTIQGSMAQAKAAWDNWLLAIGTGENVKEATQRLIDSITAALQNIIPAVGQIFESLGSLIAESFSEAFPELAEAISGVIDTISGIVGGLLERLQPVFDAIAPLAQGLADILYATVCAAFDFLASAIQTVADILSYVWDNILVPFATWCQETFGPIIEAVGGFFQGVAQIAGESNQEIVDSTMVMYGNTDTTWKNMQRNADGTWSYVEKAVSDSMAGAESSVSSATAGISSDLGGLESSANSTANNVVNSFWGLGNRISNAIGNVTKRPHISIEWIEVGGSRVAMPTMEWYAKGGFVDGATLIGAGEAGPEMILPEKGAFMDRFADAITSRMNGGNGGNSINVYLQYDASADANQMANDIAHALSRKLALEGAA